MPINNYIEKTDVTLSSNTTTTVTFTDESIKSNSNVELECTEDIQYDSKTISNGTCSYVIPKQDTTKVVSFRLYVDTPYYKSTSISNLGNATINKVKSGKTFSSANGVGLTGTGALMYYRQLGETVTCIITSNGGASVSDYQCDVVYVDSTQMCLLGNSSLVSSGATYSSANAYTWTATFAAGQVSDEAVTITNIKIPTKDQIVSMCNAREKQLGRFVNNKCWMRDGSNDSYAYSVNNSGNIVNYNTSSNEMFGVLPYIII